VTTHDDAAPSTALTLALVAELAASRQVNERQAEQLVRAAETIGQLRAHLSTLEARTAPHAVETAPPGPHTAQCRVWVPWALLTAILVVALMVGQPSWVW
jgi:hypothetical protein